MDRPSLLCISQSFAPETTPTAIRASKLLQRLAATWDVTVLTEADGVEADGVDGVRVVSVASRRPRRLLTAIRRARLDKLLDLLVWPDDSIFWALPAIRAGRRLIREREPAALVVFMMPYSAGLVGLVLSRLTGVPLVLNLDDSPTCTDMHPSFPSRLHYLLARRLEDAYARSSDALIYVSQTNMRGLLARQPQTRERVHLVRYGADLGDLRAARPAEDRFEIAYVGAMSGWWTLIEDGSRPSALKRAFRAWTRLGRFERTTLDQRTSSPVVIGRAIVEAVERRPDWKGRVELTIHGNPYPPELVARAVRDAEVEDVVTVLGPVAHARVAEILSRADLLFITLPKRVDGSPGGRISAKTYEYLMTDRPILAAVPRGENWDYLADKPGIWLVAPDDRERMREVIAELAAAKLAGRPAAFDRSALRERISYDARAREFEQVIRAAIAGP
jgi:hypothetical protein